MAQEEKNGDVKDVNNAENAAEIAAAMKKGPSDDAVCPTCNKKIKDEHGSYTAKYHDGEWYHNNGECLPELVCKECLKVIDTTQGYIPSGPYHVDCYYLKLGECPGCGKGFDKSETAVKDIRQTSKLGNWHRDCFKCSKCEKVIEENEYAVLEGKPIHSFCA